MSSRPVPIFQVKRRKSTKKTAFRLIKWVFLLALLILAAIFILKTFPSVLGNFSKSLGNFGPKIASQSAQKAPTDEQKIKALIEEKSVFEVEKVTKPSSKYLEVKAKTGLVVYFSLEKNLSEEVTTLQTLLAKAKIDNRNLKKVDFRFEKIVVE